MFSSLKGYRTLILNGAHFVIAVGTAAAGTALISGHPRATAIISAVIAVAGFALRFVTDTPVGENPQS